MSKFGKQGPNKGRYKKHDGGRFVKAPVVGAQAREILDAIDENCAVIKNFKGYAEELDAKHDKYERIVKISRDVTIESKRIIFLLHTIDRESRTDTVLKEAESRLAGLISQHYMLIARELEGQDPYLFHRAFSSGLQEFIEAYTLYDFLKNEQFHHWDEYQKQLTYEISNLPVKSVAEAFSAASSGLPPEEPSTRQVVAIIPPLDYILGLADLSGELMRKCINNLGAGDIKGCFNTCNIVRKLYTGFQSIGPTRNKEMSHKAFTLRQSLLKMEMVCYNIHVRGTEIPKHMLADVLTHDEYPEDEGYYN